MCAAAANAAMPSLEYSVGVSSCSSALAAASGPHSLNSRTGAVTLCSRNSMPSSTSATARRLAPPASAAFATAGPPCPYPWALTTAHSSAGATRRASTPALCATAARSISAQAGRERPWAMVTASSATSGAGATSRIGAPSAIATLTGSDGSVLERAQHPGQQ